MPGRISFQRIFTTRLAPFATCKWEIRKAQISDANGNIIYSASGLEFPAHWSQLATDIVAAKYFRKNITSNKNSKKKSNAIKSETSLKHLIRRVVNAITKSGQKQKYFSSTNSAKIFADELTYLLLHQYGSFNSPVWFNVGLAEEYGIKGEASGYHTNEQGKTIPNSDSYSHPQASACFIQSIKDDLDSIFSLAKNEAQIFKYGSGTGTNFSPLRGKMEKLSGGGESSGLISFLEVLDRGAGAIKSGGTTRRAAKMVVLDADHPEIFEFIEWKAKEEKKAKALIGAGYSSDFEGEAYRSISGQNANLSVRIGDVFFHQLKAGKSWSTRARTNGKIIESFPAKKLWDSLAQAAWESADPGLQFSTTINSWHTCPQSGIINSSNPCAEFVFLDDTACNLASLNILKFIDPETGKLQINKFQAACRIFLLAQEILVDYAGYPTELIAKNSHEYRPLGLGLTNLGATLMRLGLPYDSDTGRSLAAGISALLQGSALETSAAIAKTKGSFKGFKKNRKAMLAIVQKHLSAIDKLFSTNISDPASSKVSNNKNISPDFFLNEIHEAAKKSLENALAAGKKYGYRNAQVSAIAPTGTISLMLDCDTTGIEPEFSLVKTKKLSGGGELKITNGSIDFALKKLGYSEETQNKILQYISSNGDVSACPLLKESDQAVFACAQPSGKNGISISGHLQMLAAVQPFISGAISKTVNLPSSATVMDIQNVYMSAWELGLKSISVYRDGSKFSQPLQTKILCTVCGKEAKKVGGCIQCSYCGNTTSCG